MGNKILRPNQLEPLSGFNDDQISYLKDKFEILCDQSKLLSIAKISDAFKCSRQEAAKILNYIDFQNQGQVDFYEFTCAAATLHQNDDDALEFLYDLFGNNQELDQAAFEMLYGTVFRYLKFLDKIPEEYDNQIAIKKFNQYDYNKNSKIGFEQFKSMLTNDPHCRMWMELLGFVQQRPKQIQQKPQNQQNVEGEEFKVQEAEGDQAGSTPSWIKTVNYMAPQNYKLPEGIDTAPTSNLEIQYVYGYRCYDTRDNLKYNSNGEVVYHTAGCGIVLNKVKNTMKVTTAHNNDITCLDLNVGKNLAATGEMGRRPSIIVWDPITMETKNVFKSKLQKSVANIAISKSGRYLAANSMSDNHEIAVYDLTKNSLISFGPGPKSVIYVLKFTNNQEEVVCACQKQVVFVKFQSGRVQTKRGIFGKAPMTANFCIGIVGDAVVTGMANGALGYWKGNMCSRVYKQHVKPITALCERQDGGLISGDSSGCIVLWTPNLSKERQLQLSKLVPNSNNPRIISLCEGFGNILIGTRGGQVIQVQQKNSATNILMEGHFDQQLWGLAVSSNRHEFITGGQDKLLIKWDSDKRKISTKKKTQYSISSLDISRNGELAVGHTNGVIHFYDSDKLKFIRKIQTFKNPDRQVISVVKFSPNGSILAVGYCPPISEVYLYNVQNGSKIGQCKGSPSRILSIDYTRDGSSIMINNTSYEILFYNTANAAQMRQATAFRNEQFATMTCRFSWHTKGIWPPCADGSDINSLDRSNNKKYLVTADDFSLVKLFKYPACKNRQIYNQYKGHSSHVTGIKWMYDDKYVISTGGLEKSIIQWVFDDAAQIVYDYEEPEQEQQKLINQNQQYENKDEEEVKQDQEGQFKMEVEEGDEALAVKPFLGQVQRSTPASFKSLNMKNVAPDQDLSIKHVWGIRNQYINDRVRNQLRYSDSFKTCFFITAALGVQMDLKTKNQKFFEGQTQDLISFAITKDRKYIATGQMAQLNKDSKQARQKIVDVYIWDTETRQRKAKLGGFHQRAIVVVEFSPSGKKLLTVGQDDKNSLAVYNWETNRISFQSPVCGAKVTGGAWKNENQFMTVGLKHVKLWTNNKGVMCKVPGKWDPMTSVISWNQKYVSGSIQGTLYLWTGTTGVATKAHEGSIDCLSVDPNGTLFSGCSKGIINKWKYSGGKIVLDQKILNMADIDKFNPGVLSLDFSPDNYLICTNSSSIYEVPKNSKQGVNTVMQSHYEVQLWGQSWSNDQTKFVSAGDDKTVRIYDTNTFEMLHSVKLDTRIRGVDWQKTKGQLIVVGDYNGKLHLFDNKLEKLAQHRTKQSKTKPRQQPYWIQAIRFSPNGEYVALGTHGGTTYITLVQIKDNKFGAELNSTHLVSSAVLSVDWSQDSAHLAIVSQAYQLQFTNLVDKTNASSMRDVKWATWSGKFGAYVQQIHQDVNYAKTNAVDMSPSGTMIATGSDDQKVRLFKSPVIVPKQKHKAFDGHSSHITNVKFSRNQQYLLSTGGNDRTIILWKLSGFEQQQPQQQNKAEQQQGQVEGDQGNEDADFISIPKTEQQKQQKEDKPKVQSDEFQMDVDEGDQFMAVKPWLGAIKEPSNSDYYKGTGKAPNAELELQYAHGYRTKDCRNNLIYVSENKIAYHTAGLGVIMDISTSPRSQNFFNMHTDDIISMCWNEDKSSIFTGEMGAKPIVYQWNTKGQMIHKYRGAKKGVSALGANEKYLVAAGMDDDHQMYLFDLQSEKLICSQKGGRQFITALRWLDAQTFVTIGVKHYKLWTVSGKSMKGKAGSFGKNCNLLVCLGVKGSNIYVGASDGSLQVWSGNSCTNSKKVHSKSLNTLVLKGDLIITGSRDETICISQASSLNELKRIDCKAQLINSVNAQVEALDVFENKIIVGTRGSQIYELKSNKAIVDTDQQTKIKLQGHYMSGHYAPNHVTNEVWGLAVYDSIYYLTSSDDGTMRVWDINKKQQVMVCNLDLNQNLTKRQVKAPEKFLPGSCKGNSICVSKNGQVIVGCKNGRIIVFDNKFSPKLVQNVTSKQISMIKLSPDQSVLGVGDHDGRIYLLEWNRGAKKMRVRTNKIKHPSTIKHFDFSRDSNVIHSTCTSYNLLFWNVQNGQLIGSGASSYRDQDWATWTIPLGWPVQGIFQRQMDGTDINAVDRSKKTFGQKGMRLLASADDRGQVRLLQYPCLVKNSLAVVGKGHSSHVTSVQFSTDDRLLFSTGGEDQTVLQWKVNAS